MNIRKVFQAIHSSAQELLLVLCFITTLVTTSCKNELNEIPSDLSLQNLQDDRATDVTIIFSENGKTKARLKGKEFIKNEKAKPPYIDLNHGLKVDFFDDSLNVESTLTALTARYYTQDENVLVRDSVLVVNKKGERLQTEELVWNQKLERFYTDKFVRITIGDQITYGEGLEANQDFTWFRIKKQRGSIPVSDEEFPGE